jgi:hypothetical protein
MPPPQGGGMGMPPPPGGGMGMPPPQGGGGMPPPPQQQGMPPPPQQGMPPPPGGMQQQQQSMFPPSSGVPQAFADPEGGSYEGGGGEGGGAPGMPPGGFSNPKGAPPTGGFPNQPPPPTGGRHVGYIPPPPGGMPGQTGGGGGPVPQPAAPVQFFNPAAVPQRQPKASATAAGAGDMGASGAADQMSNMAIRNTPTPAFTLGDVAPGPSDWQREPINPIPDGVGQSQPRYMQVLRCCRL